MINNNIENNENNGEINDACAPVSVPTRNKHKSSALMLVGWFVFAVGLTSATYSAWEYREQELTTMRVLRAENQRLATELAAMKKKPASSSWTDKLAFWK